MLGRIFIFFGWFDILILCWRSQVKLSLVHCKHFCLFNLLVQEFAVFFKACGETVLPVSFPELNPDAEQGLDDNVDVANLVLEGVASGAVKECRQRVVELALEVPLLVILLHFAAEPLEVLNRVLARVRMVCGVKSHVQNQLFVFIVVLREILVSHTAFERHYTQMNWRDETY